MRSRRDAIAIATLLLAFALIAILLRPHADELDPQDVRATTYRSSATGTRALYLLMEELKLPVERELDPWTVQAPPGALILLAPSDQPTNREVAALLSWVRAGGTLIYAGSFGTDALRTGLGLRYRPLAAPSARDSGAVARAAAHPWTAGVDSVSGFRRAFAYEPQVLARDSITVLVRAAPDMPTVVTFRFGAGRVVAWSDANPLRNAQLRDGGAAVLFARAAATAVADSGVIRFDEFHQGFRAAGPFGALRRFLVETRSGRGVLQALVAGLALLVLAGRRFGAPVLQTRERRRSPLEHVEAVAAVYRRANARRTTRHLLMSGVERRLGRRIIGTDGAVADTALNQSVQAQRLREEWERGSEGDLVALATAVDDYVTEVRWT